MYETKILPKEEYQRLVGTEAEPLINDLGDETTVLVIEKDGKIVGSWLMIQTYHAECVWIDPNEAGNPVIPNRLIKGMMNIAKAVGAKHLVTSALDKNVVRLIVEHLKGKKIPGKHFVFPVE
jgi:N-acyl-L-homoserine lactone synthetase